MAWRQLVFLVLVIYVIIGIPGSAFAHCKCDEYSGIDFYCKILVPETEKSAAVKNPIEI